MSLILNGLCLTGSILRTNLTTKVIPVRFICSTVVQFCDVKEKTQKKIDPSKDRSEPIPVETSIQYLQSTAYKTFYGNHAVWQLYVRKHKGQLPPRKTRKTCIRKNVISTGNPCPICRDEYLVLDYRNIGLLKQFISEYDGSILSYTKTGLCQRAHNNLLVAVFKAWDYGFLTFEVPFRRYDYSEWNPHMN